MSKITKEEFDAMDTMSRRVFLARDVLAQLKIGKFLQGRDYFSFKDQDDDWLSYYDYKEENAKSFMDQDQVKCEVCAKGALVCSYVLNFNEKKVGEMDSDMKEMHDIFGSKMWHAIEGLYEHFDTSFYIVTNFWIVSENPYYRRMDLLMQNIIDNNGKLVVEVRKGEYTAMGSDERLTITIE